MSRNPKKIVRWITIALAVALFCCSHAIAKKPPKPPGGGGGGPGNNGGGVIYFSYEGHLYTMNDDGSGVAEVTGYNNAFGAWGDPSYELHGGKRWLLQDWAGAIVAQSDAGDLVELPIPPHLQILGEPIWGREDVFISFEGRVWDMDPASPTYGTVLEGGLYATGYTVDVDGNLTGSDGTAERLFGVELVVDSQGDPRPDMRYHDWAPDGVRFVFDRVSAPILEIGDILSGNLTRLYFDPTDRSAHFARWSPAGDKIAFHRSPELGHLRIMLINADGSGLKMLVRGSPNWTRTLPAWSPTGSHLLYHHWDHFYSDSYIVRVTAEGSGKTRITDKSMGAGPFTPRALGWRH